MLIDGRRHRIVMVNDCRALAVPCEKKIVTLTTLGGKTVQFKRNETGVGISPNSECEILGMEN